MVVHVARVSKTGKSTGIVLHPALLAAVKLNRGDQVAIRVAGEKLIIERIPLEQLAKLKTGEAEVRP